MRALPPVAVLLRRPELVVRRRMIAELLAAGHEDFLPAHLGVFQHPGPDGQRPGVLAARNHASKQAMNHLLHQLETAGYLVRCPDPSDRRLRVVRLTDRGWAAMEVVRQVGLAIEAEWAAELGPDVYRALQQGLGRLDGLLDATVAENRPDAPSRGGAVPGRGGHAAAAAGDE